MVANLVALLVLAAPTVELSQNSYASTYGLLRTAAAKPDTPPAALADGVNKLRALETTFPDRFKQRNGAEVSGDRARTNTLYWRALDSYVYAATTVDTLKASEASLPEKTGGNLVSKDAVEAIALAIQPALDAKVADPQTKDIDADLAYWKSDVEPKLDSILDGAMSKFQLDKAPKKLRILIVPGSGGKEAVDFKGSNGPSIAVGADEFNQADFAEVVIHELLHSIIDPNKEKGFFADLERGLKSASVKEDEVQRTVHASIAVAAAIITRANLNPGHIDVGDRYGSDTKGMERSRLAVAQPMKDFYDGRSDANSTIQAIVAAVKK